MRIDGLNSSIDEGVFESKEPYTESDYTESNSKIEVWQEDALKGRTNDFPTQTNGRAGWRRVQTEIATPHLEEESFLQVLERVQLALKERRYADALLLTEKKARSEIGFLDTFRLCLKSFCQGMLGQSEEALSTVNAAISGIESEIEKCKEANRKAIEEAGVDADYIDVIIKSLNERTDKEARWILKDALIQSGILKLSLQQRDEAIVDFRQASHSLEGLDSIFLLKVLEKKLGVSLFPTKGENLEDLERLIVQDEYEKALALVSQDDRDYTNGYYDRLICYALMGKYREAHACYEQMDLTPFFQEDYPPIPAVLHYLAGDLEMARSEAAQWPSISYPDFLLLLSQTRSLF